MMFHVNLRKSKQKNVTKAAREQYEQWLASHQKPIIKKLHTPSTKLSGLTVAPPPKILVDRNFAMVPLTCGIPLVAV